MDNQSNNVERLHKVFRSWDKDGRGVLPKKVLLEVLGRAASGVLQGQITPLLDTFAKDNPDGDIDYKAFVDWLFKPHAVKTVATKDASPHPGDKASLLNAYSSMPGLGELDFPGFPTQECPQVLDGIANHKSITARVLHQMPELYESLRDQGTSFGVTLGNIIKPAMDCPSLNIVGCVAGDAESYTTFHKLFHQIRQVTHSKNVDGAKAHAECSPTSAVELSDAPVDPTGEHVVSIRVRCVRNIQGFRFLPTCSREERRQVETLLVTALKNLEVAKVQGKYYPLILSCSCPLKHCSMTADEEKELEELGLLFHEPDSEPRLASGIGRHWPDARGVFTSLDRVKQLVAWINEQDHLRLSVIQPGGDIKDAYLRLNKALETVSQSLAGEGQQFACNQDLGFLSVCPLELNGGLRASVTMRLPALSSQPNFPKLIETFGLQARKAGAKDSGGSVPGTIIVSKQAQIGDSEVLTMKLVMDVCTRLVQLEQGQRKSIFNILPGMGHDEFPGFTTDAGPPELPDLSQHVNVAAMVLRSDVSMYKHLRGIHTKLGVSFEKCIKPCIDCPSVKGCGAVAGDADSYEVFRDLFDKVLHAVGFCDERAKVVTDLNTSQVSKIDLDPYHKHVAGVHVQALRNISAFPFVNACHRAQRIQVEQLLVRVMSQLEGDQCTYYPLRNSSSYTAKPGGMTAEEEEMLAAKGWMIPQPESLMVISAGFGKSWPEARGVFTTSNDRITAWCNEHDHLNLVCSSPSGDLKEAFYHMSCTLQAIEQSLKAEGHSFAYSDRLGFLTPFPTDMGKAFRATVVLRLPNLQLDKTFKHMCQTEGLLAHRRQIRSSGEDKVGSEWEVSNLESRGFSEVELVNKLMQGCAKLVQLEHELAVAKAGKATPVENEEHASPAAAVKPASEACNDSSLVAPPASPPAELAVPSAFRIFPGLGPDDYPGFPTDVCPEKMPNISKGQSSTAEVLRSNPSLYKLLGDKRTKLGVSFPRCIKPCMDSLSSRGVGSFAGDAECYSLFSPFFDEVIRMHQESVASALQGQQVQMVPQHVNICGPHALEVHVQCRRNLAGIRFPPACNQQERKEVERVLVKALKQLQDEDLRGNYYPLHHSTSFRERPSGMSEDEEDELDRLCFLFREPESPVLLSAGLGRDWPEARGVFAASSRQLVAWINEQDHLRLASLEAGSDLRTAFERLQRAMARIEKMLEVEGYMFERTDRLGYLTASPTDLGSTIRATVTMQLPLLSATTNLRHFCSTFGLQARRGQKAGVYEFGAVDMLNTSDIEVINKMIFGCIQLIGMEALLVAGAASKRVVASSLNEALRSSAPEIVTDDLRSVSTEQLQTLLVKLCPSLTSGEIDKALRVAPKHANDRVDLRGFFHWLFEESPHVVSGQAQLAVAAEERIR